MPCNHDEHWTLAIFDQTKDPKLLLFDASAQHDTIKDQLEAQVGPVAIQKEKVRKQQVWNSY